MATSTKSAPAKEPVTESGILLSDHLKEYVRHLPQDTKQKAQPEIAKFIRWVGDRNVDTLNASEVGGYSDEFGARTSTTEAAERLGHVKNFLNYLKKQGHIENNLAQHLRIRKGRTNSSKARTVSGKSQEVKLTRAGYNDLMKRLSQLQEERVRLAAEIHRAAADKDVRENAPLEAARENQGMVVSRIRDIESTLKQAVVMDEERNDKGLVRVGSKVTLRDTASDRTMSFQLVEPNEASPLTGKISVASPVGASIHGRSAGDQVTVKTPSGSHVYVIEKAG